MKRCLILFVIFYSIVIIRLAGNAQEHAYYEIDRQEYKVTTGIERVKTLSRLLRVKEKNYAERYEIYETVNDRELFELIKCNLFEQEDTGQWININVDEKELFEEIETLNGTTKYTLVVKKHVRPLKIEYQVRIVEKKQMIKNEFWNVCSFNVEIPTKEGECEITIPRKRDIYYYVEGNESGPEIVRNNNETIYRWSFTNELINHVNRNGIITVIISSMSGWGKISEYYTSEYETKIENIQNIDYIFEKYMGKQKITDIDKTERISIIKKTFRAYKEDSSSDLLLPQKSSITLARKRGDCKDISVLAVSLLRAAGIESYVVLTNSKYKSKLEDMIPYPYAFDHAYVFIPKQNGLKNSVFMNPLESGNGREDVHSGLILCKGNSLFLN